MKKVSELEGEELDLWVLRALANNPKFVDHLIPPKFSSSWSEGGPIIELAKITIDQLIVYPNARCWIWDEVKRGPYVYEGETALIAAMRCFVAFKFGWHEVDDIQTGG